MLYHVLFGLLTMVGLNKVNIDLRVFMVNNEVDGLCFLCAMISKTQIDTVGMVHAISDIPIKYNHLYDHRTLCPHSHLRH
jgi:hypothetical protein